MVEILFLAQSLATQCLEAPLEELQKPSRAPLAVALTSSVIAHGVLVQGLEQVTLRENRIEEDPTSASAPDWKEVALHLLEHPKNPNLGWTILAAQLEGMDPQDAQMVLGDYKKLVGNLQKLSRKIRGLALDQQVMEIRKLFLNAGMRHYCIEYPKLTDIFERYCGNCNAQTLLMVAALTDAGLRYPPGWKLGVQSMVKHVRPVLYNLGEGRSMDLVYQKTEPLVDPTLDPRAMLVPLLRDSGVNVVRPDLLVRQGQGGEGWVKGSYFNISTLVRKFIQGPAPRRGTIDLVPSGFDGSGEGWLASLFSSFSGGGG